ncbi:MAG: neutral zinc metallopeptidase [Burkholderiales bacterium]|uniref:Neutral zinc metallopeptidase n=1 Tax=Ottowia pentelensis TaxID=511108 RepID=A0ABV6PS68_9BURK|nr:neutral zinc metallopeptidase [Ottowia sp.]MBN9406206.1 neutral zinc metallopeptidase [Burkholderiales bacterium]MBS0404597.1 neutral zinc metallopeptidase [Pseudomonadota bacterium]
MRWEGQRESENVEDRRSGGGGGGGFGIGGRGIGIGTIVVALIGWGVFGINPLTTIGVLSGGGGQPVQQQGPAHAPPANDKNAAFVSTVLASTEDVWSQIFQQAGQRYPAPKLVLYRGATPTACGTGQSAMGPFYCPGDQKVYLDMDFFDTMTRQLGAPGEFARAYVVAHEVGHHVQNLEGITGKVDAMRGRISAAQQNALSVRLELQADCYAGIWANKSQQAKQWLDAGDIESAINAAQQIGDDTLQKRSQGYAVPDSFTHGSSAQRVRWFTQGFKTGSVQACDTFNAQGL